MTTTWNPLVHLNHAWSNTKTVWGKVAIVVFYALLWVGILTSAWSLIVPESQGLSCVTDSFGDDATARSIYIQLWRGYNVFAIGFLLYADMGGLHLRNVFMVAVVVVVSFAVFAAPTAKTLHDLDCIHAVRAQAWIYPIWSVLAVVLTILEERRGDGGSSAAERQPLTSA